MREGCTGRRLGGRAGGATLPPSLLALLILLAASAPATAHGAVAPREVDTRVLLDDDGLLAFGGCVEGECPPQAHEGLDLLSLDARELRLPDGRAGIAFAVAFQWQAEGVDGRSVRMQFLAGGQQQAVTILGPDTGRPTVAGAEKVVGPTPIGDGDPRMVEAWFALPTLGLAEGMELSSVTVQSFRGERLDDAMPGGWYEDGAQVPHVPHSADPGEALEAQEPGRYTTKGPALLLDASAPQPDSLSFPKAYEVTVRNPLSNLSQVVAVAVSPAGTARADTPGFVLAPGGSRTLNVTANAHASGRANVTFASDLGGWASFDLPFIAHPPGNTTTSATSAPSPPPKDTPAPGPAASALLLAAAAIALHRRR